MEIHNAPPKIPSIPAGTPATEWADKTESILSSESAQDDLAGQGESQPQVPIRTTTNVSTPGHEFPGSYPKELEHQETQGSKGPKSGDNSNNPPMGASVVHAAKQYMPNQVERGVEYASQTAAAYLPIPQGIKDTVVSYWSFDEAQKEEEGHTSLPSTELKGAQPSEHTSGVGALPGAISESSVALLPDERAARRAQTPLGDAGTPLKETPQKGTITPVPAESAAAGVIGGGGAAGAVADIAGKDQASWSLFHAFFGACLFVPLFRAATPSQRKLARGHLDGDRANSLRLLLPCLPTAATSKDTTGTRFDEAFLLHPFGLLMFAADVLHLAGRLWQAPVNSSAVVVQKQATFPSSRGERSFVRMSPPPAQPQTEQPVQREQQTEASQASQPSKPDPIPVHSEAPQPYPQRDEVSSALPASDKNKDLPPEPTANDTKPVLPEASPTAEEELMPAKPSSRTPKRDPIAAGGAAGLAVPGPPPESHELASKYEGAETRAGTDAGKERRTIAEAGAGAGMVGAVAGAGVLSKEGPCKPFWLSLISLAKTLTAAMAEEERKKSHVASEKVDQQKPPSHETSQAQKQERATSNSGVLRTGQEEKVRDKTDVPAKGRVSEGQGNREDEVHAREDLSRDDHAGETERREEEKKHTHTTSTGKGDGYGGDYHPAELHPPSTGTSATEHNVDTKGGGAATAPSLDQVSPTSGGSPGTMKSSTTGSMGKKVGLMAKMKGEAKIIAGKMSGKEGKVEEGKRLMHGDV
ncbi:hypothetical protein HYDPIDRAFT_167957 [Hydnomerulius pinastri MD-312]|uniref:Uncharacterized protein n=1 Tax=Hydnomerulius pinastri MD-312 TaxID=994086 RepID=A0A0C9WFI6_9AGAM|nr:hypothetical protein HYDPIDRAFT_167957 [Hydnomerulius pinastri MD-312]